MENRWSIDELKNAVSTSVNKSQILAKLGTPKNGHNMGELARQILKYDIDTSHMRSGCRLSLQTVVENRERIRQNAWTRLADRRKTSRRSKDPKVLSKILYEDFKRSDRKKKLTFDLDCEFIFNTISRGCSYCGETELRMTLDRIDNTKGHSKDNVNPACCRCNSMRQNMPYEAWLFIVPQIRQAREVKVFGTWQGVSNKSKDWGQ